MPMLLRELFFAELVFGRIIFELCFPFFLSQEQERAYECRKPERERELTQHMEMMDKARTARAGRAGYADSGTSV